MPPPEDGTLGFRFKRPTPVVGWTLGILVSVFVAMALLVRFWSGGAELYQSLALDPVEVLHGRHLAGIAGWWVLHSLEDVDHLLFNGIGFYFFGTTLEEIWGRRKFIGFMLACWLGATAVVLLAALIGLGNAPVVGFSGVTLGVVIAWGLSYPDREMFFYFFRLKGLHLVYITVALQVLTALSLSRVSAAAHFGGMAVGAVYAAGSGSLRRVWLQFRLKRLQAQTDGIKAARAARIKAGPALRIIHGEKDEPPTDKRYLN